ncbi:NAD-dependent epimerase/dehydratase family protein [Paracoccus marcusii]|uniref:NAD-dependent epimerase/dehydratase family protein n=1 Tax=Paracoccus marcusii TaxID=59779 RepID=UPI002492B427|nr:NAD-dependent epimerase/dehydratase family protein [Paracoccus marcusii]
MGRPVLLVTGARGMVGQNLLHHSGIASYQLLAPTSTELDLRDKRALADYLARHRPEAVVHAAGVVGGIQANLKDPLRFLAANTEIGLNVVTGCIDAGIGTLINLSSSCIYPRALGHGLSEDRVLTGELEPTNEGYALGKIVTMRLCEFARRENPALNFKTLIPCNLYGKWDKFDPKHSHLVPAIIHKVHKAMEAKAPSIEIWGDGTARREFMYAGDLADAILRALSDPDALPDSMNIGPGLDHSINDYYRIVAGVIGWQGRFAHNLDRPVGMKQKLLNVSRQEAWGWSPATRLEDGIKATYEFYLKDRLT